MRFLLPGDGGHQPLEGLAVSPTPVSHLPGIALAALATLGFGAVLGPEAPVDAPGLVAPDLPLYDGTSVVDLVAALAIGVATALALVPIRRAASRLGRDGAARLGMSTLLLGGGAVGALALAADVLAAAASWLTTTALDRRETSAVPSTEHAR